MTIEKTLQARAESYGQFTDLSIISHTLKREMRNGDNWGKMLPYQREALEMIAHKIARLLNGDCNHVDSWHDIAGYAQLVERELLKPKDVVDIKNLPRMKGVSNLTPPSQKEVQRMMWQNSINAARNARIYGEQECSGV